jgi:hypothetical protein
VIRSAILLLSLLVPFAAGAASSRDIVLSEHAGVNKAPQIDRRDKSLTIEICASTCDYFAARKVQSEDEVWDTVLLHQAYFNEGMKAKWFRLKHWKHVSSVMAAYANKCSKYPQDATRAVCIVKYLSRRNKISYAFVKYDDDQRCAIEGDLLDTENPTGKPKCARTLKSR